MAISRDSVNRKIKEIRLPLKLGSDINVGDNITLGNVKEKKLFHDPADPASPRCTIKDPSAVTQPDGNEYGDAIFDPNGDGAVAIFDPNITDS